MASAHTLFPSSSYSSSFLFQRNPNLIYSRRPIRRRTPSPITATAADLPQKQMRLVTFLGKGGSGKTTSNSQSDDGTAVEARFSDLCKTCLSLDESISQQAMTLLKESKHLLASNMSAIGSGSPEEIERSWFAFVLYSVKKLSEGGDVGSSEQSEENGFTLKASGVSRKWRQGVKRSLGRREKLSFAGMKMDDDSTSRLVQDAYCLKELDISRSCWGSQITDNGLYKISLAKCVSNLTSISLWGMTGITDKGVNQLVSRAISLQNLNVGGTFITDDSLVAIANNCPQLKAIVLWSCRLVTESGLIMLVYKCRKLESINVWGMRVPVDCYIGLHTISPTLQIKPRGLHPSI